jgi:hypothetical protein
MRTHEAPIDRPDVRRDAGVARRYWMFVTIVEGTVEATREGDLRLAWEDTTAAVLPAGLIESSLLRAEDGTWRIVTVWESKEAVMTMRGSGEPPAALFMFEQAGSRPSVSRWRSRVGSARPERASSTRVGYRRSTVRDLGNETQLTLLGGTPTSRRDDPVAQHRRCWVAPREPSRPRAGRVDVIEQLRSVSWEGSDDRAQGALPRG